jgi:hypothetical protein
MHELVISGSDASDGRYLVNSDPPLVSVDVAGAAWQLALEYSFLRDPTGPHPFPMRVVKSMEYFPDRGLVVALAAAVPQLPPTEFNVVLSCTSLDPNPPLVASPFDFALPDCTVKRAAVLEARGANGPP